MGNTKGLGSQYIGGSEVLAVLPNGNRTIEFDSMVRELDMDPRKFPLTILLEKMKKKPSKQMQYNWMTDKRASDWVAPASTFFGGNWKASAADDGTILVADADAKLLYPSCIIVVPSIDATKTIIIKDAGTSDATYTTFTAETVGAGTIDFSGATASDQIFVIGDAFEVGSGIGTIQSQLASPQYNYIQIIQTPMGHTEEQDHIGFEGESQPAKDRRLATIRHAFKKEKIMWLGERKLKATGFSITGTTGSGTYMQTFTGGIRNSISTNVTSSVGVLTREEFDDWIDDASRYADQPVIFCGELLAKGIRDWAHGYFDITASPEVKQLGLSVMKWMTYQGRVIPIVIHHNLFQGGLAGEAYCIDLSDLNYRFIPGLDDHIVKDVQDNGMKQKIDEIRTYFGMQVGNEERHGRLSGITSCAEESKRVLVTNTVADPVVTDEAP
jgi:hypothetical protein